MKIQIFTTAIISILLTACMLLTSCGWLVTTGESGPVTTREYEFTDFNSLDVGSAFKVDISHSDTYSVQIIANESVYKNVNVNQSGNTLKIGLRWPGFFFNIHNYNLKAIITMPELSKLTLSGATKGTVSGFQSSNDCEVRLSGASDLEIDMETGKFDSSISGSSEMTAHIKSSDTKIELSGSSDMKLDITTGSFVYRSSGASEATGIVQATSTGIHLSGSSEIRFTGSGGDLVLSASGASDCKLVGYYIEDADVELSGASQADMDINGELNVSLSGASGLKYGGNPVLGHRMDISGGASMERR